MSCMAGAMGEEKQRLFMASSTGFGYSDASSSEHPNIDQSHLVMNQLQSFGPTPSEIYNLMTSNMEIIGFPSKNINQENQNINSWKGLSNKLGNHHDHHHHRHQDGDDSRFTPPQLLLQQQFMTRNSKYLDPAKELLNEFCNLGTKQSDDKTSSKMKIQKRSEEENDENAKQSLFSLNPLELQKRRTKLLQMLEEVDRRYKHYCDQMKSVVQSFEAVAGNGAATVYSSMASRAMSRHFRCLRDGILTQIRATKKAMGEKDNSTTTDAPGTSTKGETPRLRILEQKLRQQRALQQMSLMESHPWRPQRGLPERAVSVLRAWLFEHFLHPYPSDVDKHILARQTGLSRSQVSNWFINARVRLWKPMVEEMYMEDLKENEGSAAAANNDPENQNLGPPEDQKPTRDQLTRIDHSECDDLSSIINNPGKNCGDNSDEYGAMQFDFSSYSHHSASGGAAHDYGGGGGGGVSLTLGLHQHGGSGGVSLAFSPASHNSSLFYPRDQMEDCQTVQYSILDGENQNLPYRNLMGAQFLHDLAG